MPLPRMAVSGLKAVRLHAPLLEVRNRILRPEWWVRERRFYEVLRPFVPKGGLAFDIGANHGQYAVRLLDLGVGRVVSVEPQPHCAADMLMRFQGDQRVTVVPKAVGDRAGTITMFLCDADQVSSCDPRWPDRFKTQNWRDTAEVPMTTLDALVAEFGQPAFCKIDVEGFEPHVLRGLTRPIDVVSLEFAPKLVNNTRAVLRRLSELGYRSLNYAPHRTREFALPHDLPPDGAEAALTTDLPDAYHSGGDIYAFLHGR